MQRTDESELYDEYLPHAAVYLMQFADGNRIDLTVARREDYRGYCFDDRLSMVPFGQGRLPPSLPPPADLSYGVKSPVLGCFRSAATSSGGRRPTSPKGAVAGPAAVRPAPSGNLYPRDPAADAVLAGRRPAGISCISRQSWRGPEKVSSSRGLGTLLFHLCPLPAGGSVPGAFHRLPAVHPGQPEDGRNPGIFLARPLGRDGPPVYGGDPRGTSPPCPWRGLGEELSRQIQAHERRKEQEP